MKGTIEIQGMEILRPNHAGLMQLKNGNTINYGVIRITNDKVVYYTGKGLREMWKPDMTDGEKKKAEELKKLSKSTEGEQQLIEDGYIAITPFEEIVRVVF